MRERIRPGWLGGLVACLLLFLAGSAEALIIRLTPLGYVLEQSTVIVTATVDVIDPGRPGMILAVDRTLKGKAPFTRLPINLKGDAIAAKGKDTEQVLKRVAKKLPVVVFMKPRDKDHVGFVYSNGMWFGMTGVSVDGEMRWAFNHCEPYLRRTFKGTTEEMIQTVSDALAGKRKPPEVDPKEPPGLGPELDMKKGSWKNRHSSDDSGGTRLVRQGPEPVGRIGNPSCSSGTDCQSVLPPVPPELPRLAVIPTVLVGGPLAMLAMLFPSVFGGWRRWLVLLSVAGTTSTLFTLHWYFLPRLTGSWIGTPFGLWTVMTLVTVLGVCWAWRRQVVRVQAGEAELPGRVELIVLVIVSLIGVGMLGYLRWQGTSLLTPGWLPVVTLTAGMCLGSAYVALLRWTARRQQQVIPFVGTEVVVLTGLLVASIALGSGQPLGVTAANAIDGEPPRLVWTFRLPEKGAIDSTPLVAGDRVYVGAAHDDAFSPYGAVYCLDRETGNVLWTFHDGQKMKPVYSSPVLVDGRLYIGEGYHQDSFCKIYCLDPEKGEKVWEFLTGSHTESTPMVVGNRLYCGAGDDGLYCLSADKGEKVWQFPSFHIDAPPQVADGRVYAGCGIGDLYKTPALVCLAADSYYLHWRVDTKYPIWGRPAVQEARVYYGTGDGRLNESASEGGGTVGCVRAQDGKEVWTCKLPGAVLGQVVLSKWHVLVGCRDGNLYCLDRLSGHPVWKKQIGSPVAGAPVAIQGGAEYLPSLVYALGQKGELLALAPASLRTLWQDNLSERAGLPVECHSSPVVTTERDSAGKERRRIYVAATLISTARIGELHCFEDDNLVPVE